MSKCKYFTKRTITNYNTSVGGQTEDLTGLYFDNVLPEQYTIDYCTKYDNCCICKGFGGNCDFDEATRKSFNAIRKE